MLISFKAFYPIPPKERTVVHKGDIIVWKYKFICVTLYSLFFYCMVSSTASPANAYLMEYAIVVCAATCLSVYICFLCFFRLEDVLTIHLTETVGQSWGRFECSTFSNSMVNHLFYI